MKSLKFAAAGILFLLHAFSSSSQHLPAHPNVVFIAIDDLRPALGCYGEKMIQSPNLDQLASQGALFTNFYAVVPTCGASRCSLLTGMLPHTKVALTNEAIRETISGKPETDAPETFIHHLRRNGYYTVGMGKISHYADGLLYGYEDDPEGAKRELPYSWDELLFDPGKWETGWNAFFGYADGSNRQSKEKMVRPYENANVGDEGYPDGLTAKLAVKKLRELADKKQPFFLGIGFFKPHLPFNAPGKYWDLYEEANIPLTPSPDIPAHVNTASLHESGEFNQYQSGEEKASLSDPVSDAYARRLRHAYFASVSYVDAQVGKVLQQLKQSGLEKNTIIVIWSDHGWHLGDDRVWGKHTLFDWALKSVCIIKTPHMKKGEVYREIASGVDIYPTLMALCKVNMPHKTDGKSLARLLENPQAPHWENAAYSYFRDGISVRTERYRYTRYFRAQEPAVELYDHQTDPYENTNIAEDHSDIVRVLDKVWATGNTGVYSPSGHPEGK